MSSDQTPEEMQQEQPQDPQAESVRELMEAGQAQITEQMHPLPERITISVGDEFTIKGIPFFIAVINKTNLVIRPKSGRFVMDAPATKAKGRKHHGKGR